MNNKLKATLQLKAIKFGKLDQQKTAETRAVCGCKQQQDDESSV